MNFDNGTFDLITCFGVLHHIPNVSFVVSELLRVLHPDGFLLLREPISTLGDWRYKRTGVTKNERGIPIKILDKIIIHREDVKIINKSFCDSLFFHKLLKKLNINSMDWVKFDKIISWLFSWNIHYHQNSFFKKIAPGSIFYVVQKVGNA